jgi:signal peptidase I
VKYLKPNISDRALSSEHSLYLVGYSMYPTISPFDIIYYLPYDNGKYDCGDVVIFYDRDTERKIAHRIISIGPEGIRTCGDNNLYPDGKLLKVNEVLGKVAYLERDGKRRPVHGGSIGKALGKMRHVRNFSLRLLLRMVYPIYDAAARSGLFRKFFVHRSKLRYVSFKRRTGVEMQLLLGKRVIGVRHAGAVRWKLRPPYRLFIDESSLPVDGTGTSQVPMRSS